MAAYMDATAVGNIGHIALLVLTTMVTTCMLFQWPDSSWFDTQWLAHGFCVSNSDTVWYNSHALSFYVDVVLTLFIFFLYKTQPKSVPPLQAAIMLGGVMSTLGHGCGHLYLAMNPTGMDLRFRPKEDLGASIASTLVTVMVFVCIFQGTMPLSSRQRLTGTALIATAGFTLLDIKPKFNFVYAQAVIYIFNAIHMLTLEDSHKATQVYRLHAYFQLPVLVVGVLESTACQSLLEPIGGHANFDASIGIGFILLELFARHLEQEQHEVKAKSD